MTRSKKIILTLAGLAAVGVVTIGIVVFSYFSQLSPASPGNTATNTFVIDQGETNQQVATRLEEQEIIKSASALKLYMKLNMEQGFSAGTYQVSSGQTVQEIVALFQQGREESRSFTILPGKRLDQLQEVFLEAGYTQAEVDTAFDPQTHADHPISAYKPAAASLEGYIFPETFIISDNTTASKIVDLSLDEMFKAIDSTVIAGFKAQGITVHEGIILASIVEKEVSSETDKPQVSQVFIKRLNEGIQLGSDVTFFYAAEVFGGRALPSLDNPYNTRLYGGLPPGPISNMSKSTLRATAEPADTDYLYFVAGDNGTTYFSRTLQEHEQFTELYCFELCKL